uniref:Ig-like domain-containing protein n=1 Tax=Latimeria chalumnae TaxID=7897 RepID=H2ZSP8_LATCH|nr:PREDICTED: tyrosine-protein phosphatase non-receptor type substrate 1-like isoform X2 [Latimeria chalumnae]|eukprot:XP_006009383.1 PREDICTED: tyrosine-protein phosphatase non-receptor type substrate 1-like isoform X2 [Latimeria chalumnae]
MKANRTVKTSLLSTNLFLAVLTAIQTGTRGGDGNRNFTITQPAEISATAGGSVILTCTLSGDGPNGKVKWNKKSGGEERLFYTTSPREGEQPDSRASFVKDSDRDKSIRITHLTRNDSGMYYCVKFKGDNEELKRGAGSHLSVAATDEGSAVPAVVGVTIVFIFLFGIAICCYLYHKKCLEGRRSVPERLTVKGSVMQPATEDLAYADLEFPTTGSKAGVPQKARTPSQPSADTNYADVVLGNVASKAEGPSNAPAESAPEYAAVKFKK